VIQDFTSYANHVSWGDYTFSCCKFAVVFVCQKLWKLVDSRQGYCDYKRVTFIGHSVVLANTDTCPGLPLCLAQEIKDHASAISVQFCSTRSFRLTFNFRSILMLFSVILVWLYLFFCVNHWWFFVSGFDWLILKLNDWLIECSLWMSYIVISCMFFLLIFDIFYQLNVIFKYACVNIIFWTSLITFL